MKVVVATFNLEKALVGGLLRDYELSDGPSFQALVSSKREKYNSLQPPLTWRDTNFPPSLTAVLKSRTGNRKLCSVYFDQSFHRNILMVMGKLNG